MPLPKTLKDEKIVDSWAMIIIGAQGKSDFIFDTTKKLLEKNEAPGVNWELGEVTPSFFKGLFGRKRDFLLVTNEALDDYKMYIGARDYGTNLDVQWFLTCEPGFLKKISAQIDAAAGLISYLDIFAQQDLRAYATVVHHCLLQAVDSLLDNLGQDKSMINRKSKGFLEVW
jgi:hypothetical protein